MPYTTATLKQKDAPGSDGRVRIVITFTGAGETPRDRELYLDAGTTAASVRAWAWNEKQALEGRKSIADALVEGQAITLSAPVPVPPPVPTAAQVWATKAARLAHAKAMEIPIGSTLATAISDLQTDVITTYQAGFEENL